MELSADVSTYRDALRFRNGQHVKLQELCEGQRITVLNVGGQGSEEGDLWQDQAAFGEDLVPAAARCGAYRVIPVSMDISVHSNSFPYVVRQPIKVAQAY